MFLVQQTQPQGYQWPLGPREQKLLFQALVCNWLELCASEPITGPSIPEKRNLLWLPVGTRCGTANSSTYQRPQLLISPSHTCQQIIQYARDLLGGCLLNRDPPQTVLGIPRAMSWHGSQQAMFCLEPASPAWGMIVSCMSPGVFSLWLVLLTILHLLF